MSQKTDATKPRSREATAIRRARIVEAAIGLFGERGYYGFTIQELGKRCGLSNPGLLHYFPSKLELLLAVLQELEARESEFIEPLAQQAVLGDGGKPAVLAVLQALMLRATSQPDRVRLIVELQAESLDPAHPAYAWWQRRDALLRTFLTDLFQPFVHHPEAAARHVMAMMDGLCLQWLRTSPTQNAADQWDHALARLLPELHL